MSGPCSKPLYTRLDETTSELRASRRRASVESRGAWTGGEPGTLPAVLDPGVQPYHRRRDSRVGGRRDCRGMAGVEVTPVAARRGRGSAAFRAPRWRVFRS